MRELSFLEGGGTPKKRHTAEQIIGLLRQAEVEPAQGRRVGEICRGLRVSEASFYRWRAAYGGLAARGRRPVPCRGQRRSASCGDRHRRHPKCAGTRRVAPTQARGPAHALHSASSHACSSSAASTRGCVEHEVRCTARQSLSSDVYLIALSLRLTGNHASGASSRDASRAPAASPHRRDPASAPPGRHPPGHRSHPA
ncbi:transposase [Roseomonas soli]|uniref:Transposase n=1 Tax=Neoroseomonas soli TaxID=1081025 RepID=A0A9X9WZX2_9PROT|nr:transposase [Neoroseomonas soli]